jgi:hypothetical protein
MFLPNSTSSFLVYIGGNNHLRFTVTKNNTIEIVKRRTESLYIISLFQKSARYNVVEVMEATKNEKMT